MASETLERGLQRKVINLSGEWLGYYTGHFDEVVRIVQKGDYVEAVKITGDDYVPADEVTWRANVRTGLGEGQIAEREFRNPRFVPGRLQVVNSEKLVFTWDKCGEVEFRRDDC
ncbi:MAG TPA: Cyclin D1-binding domain-containing protein [Candidatus Kapabacteria bacterium]|nr:Cyclin D1-binding domain-containing protein [Candidatus Kapabacteria bacterium]